MRYPVDAQVRSACHGRERICRMFASISAECSHRPKYARFATRKYVSIRNTCQSHQNVKVMLPLLLLLLIRYVHSERRTLTSVKEVRTTPPHKHHDVFRKLAQVISSCPQFIRMSCLLLAFGYTHAHVRTSNTSRMFIFFVCVCLCLGMSVIQLF